MTKPILAICLATIGFGGLMQSSASAATADVTAPAAVRVNEIIIETGPHYHHRHYYHHRYYRYRYYRHHRYYYN